MASWLEEEHRREQERLRKSIGSSYTGSTNSYKQTNSESTANHSATETHKQRAGILIAAVIFLFIALGLKFGLNSIEREKTIGIK